MHRKRTHILVRLTWPAAAEEWHSATEGWLPVAKWLKVGECQFKLDQSAYQLSDSALGLVYHANMKSGEQIEKTRKALASAGFTRDAPQANGPETAERSEAGNLP